MKDVADVMVKVYGEVSSSVVHLDGDLELLDDRIWEKLFEKIRVDDEDQKKCLQVVLLPIRYGAKVLTDIILDRGRMIM